MVRYLLECDDWDGPQFTDGPIDPASAVMAVVKHLGNPTRPIKVSRLTSEGRFKVTIAAVELNPDEYSGDSYDDSNDDSWPPVTKPTIPDRPVTISGPHNIRPPFKFL